MTVHHWMRLNRDDLTEILPEALIIQPVGAVEQHGHHLAVGTDTLLLEAVLGPALEQTRSARDIIVAPTLATGASDHHLPLGGTLSLTGTTLVGVLGDLARSVIAAGGRRWVVVNGHGGNRGPCATALARAGTEHGLSTGYVDYWTLLPVGLAGEENLVPGHAGMFETSLLTASHPDLVDEPPRREPITLHPLVRDGAAAPGDLWASIDGYTDDPHRASPVDGGRWLSALATALARRLDDLGALL